MAKKTRAQVIQDRMAAMSANQEQSHHAEASKPHEAEALRDHDAVALQAHEADEQPASGVERLAPARKQTPSEMPKVAKKSTSLYLTDAARKAIARMAADDGVRPHRIIDDALRAYFKGRGLDFDKLNGEG